MIIYLIVNLFLLISISAQSGNQGSYYKFLINDFSMPPIIKGILTDVDSITERMADTRIFIFCSQGNF